MPGGSVLQCNRGQYSTIQYNTIKHITQNHIQHSLQPCIRKITKKKIKNTYTIETQKRLEPKVDPYMNCGVKNGNGTGFCAGTSVSPCS
jgi:hypothetical protein